jgi:hypothetical protein
MQKKVVKKKRTKHLDFYNECMKSGKMKRLFGIHYGLCNVAVHDRIDGDLLDKYFRPNEQERDKLREKGKSTVYWASGSKKDKMGEFTKLRQTIVLFMAAIKGEL